MTLKGYEARMSLVLRHQLMKPLKLSTKTLDKAHLPYMKNLVMDFLLKKALF